jgi:hypothetical protein
MVDEFSTYYADLLEGTYDCVDRIVLNGYYSLGQTPGGLRVWWRRLKGSDADLDNAHLMRLAGRLSRRVRAYAAKHQISVLDCLAGERKHLIAKEYLPTQADFAGVFLILVGRAPAPVWDVRRTRSGTGLHLSRKTAWVNHYAFHIQDPEWGHLIIKLCGQPPFNAQIILNGHEYVARQAQKAGVAFTKDGNCFTAVTEAHRLAQVADTLCSPDIIGRLTQVCERWIYSACLCFALSLAEQDQSGFQYAYSVYQAEYSRNLLFARGSQMEQVVQGVLDRTRAALDVKTLKTIFGAKHRPFRRRDQPPPRCEIELERPLYDLTVFKLHFGKLTAKLYTKGERVLRLEVIVHNARALACGTSLPKFSHIVWRLKDILSRFLNVLRCLDVTAIAETRWEDLPAPTHVGRTRVGGVDLNKPRMRAVVEAVMELAPTPHGFSSTDVAEKVRAMTHADEHTYTSRRAAYDLKKLRGKQIVRKVAQSRRYESVPEGLQTVAGLLVLQEKVIKPVLAGAGRPRRGRPPKTVAPIDAHYEALQNEMHQLFQVVGIAVN